MVSWYPPMRLELSIKQLSPKYIFLSIIFQYFQLTRIKFIPMQALSSVSSMTRNGNFYP